MSDTKRPKAAVEVGNFATYLRLLTHVRPYRRQLFIAIIGMVFYALGNAGFAWIMKPLMDQSLVAQQPNSLLWVPLGLVGIFLLRGAGAFVSSYFMAWVSWELITELRDKVVNAYLSMPLSRYQRHSSGELISRVTYNANTFASAVTDSLTVMIRDGLTVLALVALMLYYTWELTVLFLLVGPLIAWIVSRVSRRFRRLGRTIQNSMSGVTQTLQEMIEGVRVVRVFGAQAYERQRFHTINRKNRDANLKSAVTRSLGTQVVQFLVACALALIIWIATANLNGRLSVGEFVLFITAMFSLFQPIRSMTNINAVIQQAIVASQSLFEIIDTPTEPNTGRLSVPEPFDRIEINQLCYHYPERELPALEAVSFTLERGQTVALVGASGSGKSTLADLLLRFDAPSAGQITLGGVDLQQIELTALRQMIAYVGQQVVLFNDTVANNIAYGAKAPLDRAAIVQAAEAANAREFIEALPEGFDTPVGERGNKLSGGQRQRLAIARALLKNAPIIVLDEATSALDTESERRVQAALEALMNQRTVLVIAHRLSTVERADKIVVLDQGRLVEQGTHAELMALSGYYARLQHQDDRLTGGADA